MEDHRPRRCVCYSCLQDLSKERCQEGKYEEEDEEENVRATVIFLDIDGVLNNYWMTSSDSDAFHPSPQWRHKMQDWNLVISRAMLLRLATLVRRHECRIVLSTSWRVEPGAVAALAASFAAVGLGESVIIGDGQVQLDSAHTLTKYA